MKKIILLLSMLLTIALTYSQTPDSWTQKANFGGTVRTAAVGFRIGNKGYLGTGFDGINYVKDFWEYDPLTDTWMQKADFAGPERVWAVGLSIGSKGYIGTGNSYDNINQKDYYYKDFWEYDPLYNTWIQKADFGGNGRYSAVGFGLDNKGYIGSGYSYDTTTQTDNYYKDFWEYNPVADTWTKKADLVGVARVSAVGFCIGDKGYIGTGSSESTPYLKDFWEYDPSLNMWKQKADFGGSGRTTAVGFNIGNKGYVGTGFASVNGSGQFFKDFWEYNPLINIWVQKADYGGISRNEAVGFSIGNKGYMGTGGQYFGYDKDIWEYTPATNCQPPTNLKVPFISDTTAVLKWTLPVIPVNGFDIVYHVIGSTPVHKRHVTGTTNHIGAGNLLPGTIYRWKIRSDCTTDTTNWINGPDFTTLSDNLAGNAVQILPNPNNGNFIIQLQLPAKATLTILELYNNNGTKVWQQNAGMLSGRVNRNINAESKLLTGIYRLIIKNGDTQLMQKIIVNK